MCHQHVADLSLTSLDREHYNMKLGTSKRSNVIPYVSLMFLMIAFGISFVKDRVKALEISQVEMTVEIQGLRKEIVELRAEIELLNQVSTPVEEVVPIFVAEPEPVISYEDVMACSSTSTFKSYMDYRMITDGSSRQYALQQEAYTGDDGLRYVGDRVMVAMAEQSVGTIIDITLSDGDVIHGIVGDVKANTHCAHPDGSILEFIVDTDQMDSYVRMMGNYDVIYDGPISTLRLYN